MAFRESRGSSPYEQRHSTPERVPSPIQFTTSSSSSRASTPRGDAAAVADTKATTVTKTTEGDARATAASGFTVTSSQYSPVASPSSLSRALNPQAKSFEFPSAAAFPASSAGSGGLTGRPSPHGFAANGRTSSAFSPYLPLSSGLPFNGLNAPVGNGVRGSATMSGAAAMTQPEPLFAMPAHRPSPPSMGARATATRGPWAASSPKPQSSAAPHHTSGFSVNGATVPSNMSSMAAALSAGEDMGTGSLEAFIRARYTAECTERNQHMVAVFNLDPHTSCPALMNMFFPMGAASALVLPPASFPASLAALPLVSRRLVGIVFFPRKDFAMVGVEKLDHFVPHGQHQPLHVVYCGPDATSSALSGAALPPSSASSRANSQPQPTVTHPTPSVSAAAALSAPGESAGIAAASTLPWMLSVAEQEKVHAEMRERFGPQAAATRRAMVVLHGLDATTAVGVLRDRVIPLTWAVGCEPWPPQQGAITTPWRCRSISAVVWYPDEAKAVRAVATLDDMGLGDARHPVRPVFLPLTVEASGASARASPHSRGHTNGTVAFSTSTHGAGAGGAPSLVTNAREAAAAASVGLPSAPAPTNATTTGVTFVTAGTDVSSNPAQCFSEIHKHYLAKFPDPSVYLVAVHNLDSATDKERLYKIFYPIGAFDAELYPAQVNLNGKLRRSGVALFHSQGMAEEAAVKIHDFVPHGQTRPLVTFLLPRESASAAVGAVEKTCDAGATKVPGDESVNTSVSNVAEALRTPKTPAMVPSPGGATDAAAASTPCNATLAVPADAAPAQLLESVRAQLTTPTSSSVNADVLAETMARLVNHPDADDATAESLASTLSTILVEMQHHSVKLATPLSGALMTLHELLGFRESHIAASASANSSTELDSTPTATSRACASAGGPVTEKQLHFVKRIARAMMLLVANSNAAREPRNVAAMLCGYLFQFSYLSGSPYAFALRLLEENEAAVKAAKAYLAREPGVPSSAEAERVHRPWITLVESLEEMTSLWRGGVGSARYRADPAAKSYEAFIEDFYDGKPPRTGSRRTGSRHGQGSGSGHHDRRTNGSAHPNTGGGSSNGNSPSCDHLGDSVTTTATTTATTREGTGRRQALLTPSARPTPRRVVTRVSPGAGLSTPHVVKSAPITSGPSGHIPGIVMTATSTAANTKTPIMSHTTTVAPRVVLSPGSENTQGASTDVSLESNSVLGFLSTSSRPSGTAAAASLAGIPRPRAGFGVHLLNTSTGSSGLTHTGVNTSVTSTASGVSAMGLGHASGGNNNHAGGGLCVQEHRSDCCECTVYITKLPSPFRAGQVLRMLSHFGRVNKVRLCKDEKENVLSGAAGGSYNRLCYGFVEFAEPYQAKAMVEYFRNAVHTPSSFEFLRRPVDSGDGDDGTYFSEEDIDLLRVTRTSQARNPIHDQQPIDAVLRPATMADGAIYANAGMLVLVRPCLFGLLRPEVSVEEYQEVIQKEAIPPVFAALPTGTATVPMLSSPQPLPQQQQQLPVVPSSSSSLNPAGALGLHTTHARDAWPSLQASASHHQDPLQSFMGLSWNPSVVNLGAPSAGPTSGGAPGPFSTPVATQGNKGFLSSGAFATPPHVEDDSSSDDGQRVGERGADSDDDSDAEDYAAILRAAVSSMQGSLPDTKHNLDTSKGTSNADTAAAQTARGEKDDADEDDEQELQRLLARVMS